MELTQTFTVPVPIDAAWAALNDPERVAPCMPGASLETVEGDAFTGSVKVKLGPVALTYRGTARFVERDMGKRTVVIEGSGKDAKGNGSATATVTARLQEQDGATSVTTTTDLAVTGKPAQFGRGVMNDVANKLVGQFARNLAALLQAEQDLSAAEEVTASEKAQARSSTPSQVAAVPQAEALDAFALLGLSPAVRQRLIAAVVVADVFVLGWAVGRLSHRR